VFQEIIQGLSRKLNIIEAQAHCDIPCKVYDPISAQLASLSVIRFFDLIEELQKKQSLSTNEQANLIRLIGQKEVHAEKVKDEIRIIWGDYFKAPQLATHPDTHQLSHQIMQTASACKQQSNREKGEELLQLVNNFAECFWQTKGVATYRAICPYPPQEETVYTDLKEDR